MKPNSAWIEAAIRKTIESSMPSIRNMAGFVAIAQRAEGATDKFLNQMYHKGDLALQHCLYSRLYDSPRVELESTVALLVKQSDLELEKISERAAVDILYIAFAKNGAIAYRHRRRRAQADLEATSFAPVRDYFQLAEEAAEPRRGPVLQCRGREFGLQAIRTMIVVVISLFDISLIPEPGTVTKVPEFDLAEMGGSTLRPLSDLRITLTPIHE
ncbi:hypothetical protein K438DRAFT_1763529 [Mycena galopus ATCC 62051]|nr:hypothetical protein K438DRAFT_1763529 [Mycena galopus ATCC 62051]